MRKRRSGVVETYTHTTTTSANCHTQQVLLLVMVRLVPLLECSHGDKDATTSALRSAECR